MKFHRGIFFYSLYCVVVYDTEYQKFQFTAGEQDLVKDLVSVELQIEDLEKTLCLEIDNELIPE